MSLSVIIPSRNIKNLIPCVDAVRQHEPTAKIIIIDDGIQLEIHEVAALEVGPFPLTRIEGIKPFIFARNMNLGITAAGNDDVILLNDDAILKTPFGFTTMQWCATKNTDIGVISATTNHAGNPEQHPRKLDPNRSVAPSGVRVLAKATPGNSFPTVAFVCVLIPRRTIKTIGYLDERFNPGMYEDNDYCRRCKEAGLKIAVHDGCYVDHGSLQPTFRSGPSIGAKLQEARKIYMDKWKTI